MKGFFKPKNPNKYKGDIKNICFRSSYELKVMKVFDDNPNVLEWASEPFAIPYTDQSRDQTLHRYFVDFFVKLRDKNGNIRILLIEVKPAEQCKPPKKGKRNTMAYRLECLTYIRNQNKWEAAERLAKQKGWDFVVLTERELGLPDFLAS
jgi:hypothetical protein